MRKKTVKIAALVLLGCYLIGYFVLTLNGHYAATATGAAKRNSDGTLITTPKFGYRWFLPSDYDLVMKGQLSPVGILYFPLIYIDRKFWHTRDKAESLEYPIESYF